MSRSGIFFEVLIGAGATGLEYVEGLLPAERPRNLFSAAKAQESQNIQGCK